MSGALDGVKVLDLSRILAGPWATMTLGDLGAEVWKVEQPGNGDDTRSWSPPSAAGEATYFLGTNRNKKSIAIDLSCPEGREIVLQLAAKADIVVENFRPASLKKLRLTYEDLLTVNPRLIYCSISGYGRGHRLQDRPGYDFILQAECGFMAITGEPQGEPIRLGIAFIDLVTGMNAVQAILAALYVREKTGFGQQIDLALFDSGVFFLANVASSYLNTGEEPKRFGNAHPSIVPYQLFDAADGQFALAVGNDEQYRRLCEDVLDRPALYSDGRFRTNRDRVDNRRILIPLLQEAMSGFGVSALIAKLHSAGVPAGEVRSVSAAFESEAAVLRDVVVSTPHKLIGEFRSVRSPLRLSGTPPVDPLPPPTIGEHTEDILADVLSFSPGRIADLKSAGVLG